MIQSVYVMAAENGQRKIGRSKNLESRLIAIRGVARCPVELEFHCEPTHESVAVERITHFLLKDKRIDGEWFSVSLEEARNAIIEAKCIAEGPDKEHYLAAIPTLRMNKDRELRSELISVQITPSEKIRMAEAARKHDYSTSQWLRFIGIRALENDQLERLDDQPYGVGYSK